jgi:HEAT repeat protein
MTAIIALPLANDVARALERLKSLHDGDLGVVDITACGSRAVPALRALLLTGETSSIYHPRCRAVEALAALGAHYVIIEFLGSPREVANPINRSGEEAVVNAAARALIGVKDPRVFPLLLELAETRLSAGVVEALGSFGRTAALPALLRAMREDHTRPVAEAALLRLKVAACPTLAEIATRPLPSPGQESPSSRRTRLAAARLLARIGASENLFRRLIDDVDPEIAAVSCMALLDIAESTDEPDALPRLIELLPRLSWIACQDAEECLARHFRQVRDIAGKRLRTGAPDPTDASPEAVTYRALSRAARLADK